MSLLRFVTPSDVRDFKRQLDPTFRALDVDVGGCTNVPATTRQAWDNAYASWRQFFFEDESWLHTAAQMDRAEAFDRELSDWQRRIDAYQCTLSAPIHTPETPPAGTVFDTLGSALKWAAVAAGVVTTIVLIRELRT